MALSTCGVTQEKQPLFLLYTPPPPPPPQNKPPSIIGIFPEGKRLYPSTRSRTPWVMMVLFPLPTSLLVAFQHKSTGYQHKKREQRRRKRNGKEKKREERKPCKADFAVTSPSQGKKKSAMPLPRSKKEKNPPPNFYAILFPVSATVVSSLLACLSRAIQSGTPSTSVKFTKPPRQASPCIFSQPDRPARPSRTS